MPLILRVDVDNGYLYGKSKLSTLLNFINENYFSISLPSLGYLSHLAEFIDHLMNLDLSLSMFFKYNTLPHKELKNRILSNKRIDIGLHLFSARTYKEFVNEVKTIEKHFNIKIHGFTKHGDGDVKLSRRHAWLYEVEKYLKWGVEYGMNYFSGNVHGAPTEVIKINKFIYFPKVFYIEPYARKLRLTVNDVADYANSDYVVVALIHPCNFVKYHNVKKEFHTLIDKVNEIYSFKEYVGKIKV